MLNLALSHVHGILSTDGFVVPDKAGGSAPPSLHDGFRFRQCVSIFVVDDIGVRRPLASDFFNHFSNFLWVLVRLFQMLTPLFEIISLVCICRFPKLLVEPCPTLQVYLLLALHLSSAMSMVVFFSQAFFCLFLLGIYFFAISDMVEVVFVHSSSGVHSSSAYCNSGMNRFLISTVKASGMLCMSYLVAFSLLVVVCSWIFVVANSSW